MSQGGQGCQGVHGDLSFHWYHVRQLHLYHHVHLVAPEKNYIMYKNLTAIYI